MKRLLFTSLVFFTCVFSLSAQTLDATFSATSPTQHCKQGPVEFEADNKTYETYIWEILELNKSFSSTWEFDYTFSTPGKYSIKLTVTKGGDSGTFKREKYISIYKPPTVDFSLSTYSDCAPVDIFSENNSVEGDAPITSYKWYFNYIEYYSSTNFTHPFKIPGNYSVQLELTDANGCQSLDNVNLKINASPEATFTVEQNHSCIPFDNKLEYSLSTAGLTFAWDTNGIVFNTSPVYTAFFDLGVHDVTLTVTNAENCSASMTQTITVANLVADFTIIGGEDQCKSEPVDFNALTVGNNLTYEWDFGDGSPKEIGKSVNHIYDNTGDYQVELHVFDPLNIGSCNDIIPKTVTIHEIVINTIDHDTIGCMEDGNLIDFTVDAPGGVNFIWNYGIDAPETTTLPAGSYTYYNEGEYVGSLKVIDQYGCEALQPLDTIIIDFPELKGITVSEEDVKGCDREVNFSSETETTDPVDSWLWDFNDDNPTNTSIEAEPTYNFLYNDFIHANSGKCNVQLIITTTRGCTDTLEKPIYVGIKPTTKYYIYSDSTGYPDYGDHYRYCPCYTGDPEDEDPCPCEINTFVVCAYPEPINFFDSSYVEYKGVKYDMIKDSIQYSWEWDMGEEGGMSADEDPKYSYKDTVGYMDIQMVAGYNGCYDTLKTDSMVFVKGPIIKPKTTAPVDCENSHDFEISTEIVSVTRFLVDYRNIDSTDYIAIIDTTFNRDTTYTTVEGGAPFKIQHHFDEPGDYYVKFTAFNDSTDSPNGEDSPAGFYEELGYLYPAYDDSNYVTNPKHNCEHIDSILIKVRDISAAINLEDSTICAGIDEVKIIDGSNDNFENSITYFIDFGDGMTTTDTSQTHIYADAQVYNIQVIATSDNGCADTATADVYAFKPVANFNPPTFENSDQCAPFNANFIDKSVAFPAFSEIEKWHWEFGDGDTESIQNPSHQYVLKNPTFTVSLEVTDAVGCEHDTTQSFNTWFPVANFNANDQTLCFGEDLELTNSSIGENLGLDVDLGYEWELGDGSGTSTLQNPTYNYADTGNYDIQLIVYAIGDELTCRDTLFEDKFVYVQAIDAGFTTDNAVIDCYPWDDCQLTYNGEFHDFIETYNWFYINSEGEEFPLPSKDTITVKFPAPDLYSIKLTTQLNSAFECEATETKEDTIDAKGPVADFMVQSGETDICIGDDITFVMYDTLFVASVNWDYGDGVADLTAGTTTLKTHQYNNFGDFKANLFAYDESGTCYDGKVIDISVKEIVAGFTTDDHDQSHCVPLNGVDFIDTTLNAISWEWSLNDSIISTTQTPTAQDFSKAGDYNIKLVVNDPNCEATVETTISVFDPPIIVVSPNDIICPGESTQLWVTGAKTYLWKPFASLSDSISDTPFAKPDVTTLYTVVGSTGERCTATATVEIAIQEVPEITLLSPQQSDTAVFIGETVMINASIDQKDAVYSWLPTEGLVFVDDDSLKAFVLAEEDMTFELTVFDKLQCSSEDATINIHVLKEYAFDIPSAFSPNGDNDNDFVYVRGWGIKALKDLKIYNRWGQLIFQTDDINEGWDGFYKGKPQNIDTYVWVATVEYLDGQEQTKKGTINLLR